MSRGRSLLDSGPRVGGRGSRGRAMPTTDARPITAIADETTTTISRMRSDAERLRELGREARARVDHAVQTADQMLGNIFETGAKHLCEKLDELEKAFKK
jgi:hypothetical protein